MAHSPSSPPAAATPSSRLMSVDVYRGFVMFLMAAELLHLPHVAEHFSKSHFWQWVGFQTTHVEWVGCSLHDLIQPSFSLLVGVALPYSLASRQKRGDSWLTMWGHAAWRAVALILLGVFLRSVGREQTNWTLEDTLSQIGLGYLFLFAAGFGSTRQIVVGLVVVLLGYWLAFVWYPLPSAHFDYAAVGVPAEWHAEHALTGFSAHWNKNSNFAWAADRVILNAFPRQTPFEFNGGGYATLSFIPTLGTMMLGLLAGKRLRQDDPWPHKTGWLLLVGVVCLAGGLALHAAGLCPIVKKIWTPSWTLASGGLCLLMLAVFYTIIDGLDCQAWAFPLRVIGMNSIAIYVLVHLIDRFILDSFHTHLGPRIFRVAGELWEPTLGGAATLAVFWWMLYWMYRRQIFIRV